MGARVILRIFRLKSVLTAPFGGPDYILAKADYLKMPGTDSFNIHQAARWLAENYVLLLGFTAQGLFFGRFLVQWIASEKQGKSVVPLAFWYFSVCGGGLLFVYAILKKDPVFIVGQGGGLLIYVRNLYLIYKERAGKHSPEDPDQQHAK